MALSLPLIFLSVLLSSQANEEDNSILMKLVTHDVAITTDDVGICRGYRLPTNGTYNIVEFMPRPLQEVYHHLNVYLCKEIGAPEPVRSTVPLDQLAWNCIEPNTQPGLPIGNCCEKQDFPAFASFDMGTAGLKLPDGYGFRVGGDSGFNYVVMEAHYPEAKKTMNGRTGHSEMTIKLVPDDPKKKTKRVGLFNLSSWALIPPKSVTSMNGSYVYDQPIPMTPVALLTHTHELGTDFEFWRKTVGGNNTLMWKQNPVEEFLFLVPPHPLATISNGDTLSIRCTFNNTSNALLVVESYEMCNLLIIYAVDGDELLPVPNVYTVRKEEADLFLKQIPSWIIVQN